MTINVIDQIAQHIRIVDGGNRMTPADLGVAVADYVCGDLGQRDGYQDEIVRFVKNINPDKDMGAGALAELLVAEFNLDGQG